MIIKNGSVFQEDKSFQVRELYIEGERIVSGMEEITDTSVINAEGMLVLPGLIDIHSHGAAGHDFCDADARGLERILSYQRGHGITTYCPTTMTLPKERLLQIFQGINEYFSDMTYLSEIKHHNEEQKKSLSRIAGIHMEGPFLDPEKKGAHREEALLMPDIDFFRKCNDACGGKIRLITLSPSLDGAVRFIEEIKDETVVSLGHTCADYETAKAAFRAGACHVTHLFNAMNPLGHRAPGLIGAASEEETCMAELICDGIHVHESIVRAAFQLFPERIVLISDSIRATGMGDGVFKLGGLQVAVRGKKAFLPDGTIAGSVTNLYDCMRNAVSFGIPLGEAVAAASVNPAKSIGIYHETGSLSPGKRADILLTDKNLNLLKVISSGYCADSSLA